MLKLSNFSKNVFTNFKLIGTSLILLLIILISFGCEAVKDVPVKVITENWSARQIELPALDSLELGESYLSIYSQIYSFSQAKKYNLTVMVSLRNTSEADSIYLTRVEYFNTEGHKVKSYIEKPVYLAPLETVDIVIDQNDKSGGTGANFIIDWYIPKDSSEPIFEAVMNSMQATQGLSFVTHGVRVK